jgi:hypothetical protein
LSLNSFTSVSLKLKIIFSLFESSLILLLTSRLIKESIHNKKLEGKPSSIALKRELSRLSYFLSRIIFTKKLARRKSPFFAFFSSL